MLPVEGGICKIKLNIKSTKQNLEFPFLQLVSYFSNNLLLSSFLIFEKYFRYFSQKILITKSNFIIFIIIFYLFLFIQMSAGSHRRLFFRRQLYSELYSRYVIYFSQRKCDISILGRIMCYIYIFSCFHLH